MLSWQQFVCAQRLHFTNYALLDDNNQKTIQCIVQDSLDNIYVASKDQLYCFIGQSYEKIDFPNPTTSAIRSLYSERKNNVDIVWIGLENGAILNNEKGDFDVLTNDQFETAYPISGLLTNEQELWIATYGDGLHVGANRVDSLQKVSEIFSDDIYSITSDDKGQIWVATDVGLFSCQLKGDEIKVEHFGKKQTAT